MSFLKSFSVLSILWVTTLCISPSTTMAARFNIQNNCPFTVWAGAVPGGDRQLNSGESWPLDPWTLSLRLRASGGIQCTTDINGQCPNELKAPGGCNNPCTVFKTYEYFCNSRSCGPTTFSKFFKDWCPDAYSYPKDDTTSKVVFTCPGGTNYRVVFCP
ncbi:hypothetical protein M0R45_019737 [Rubus argutus]|uniref:Thaumatin-like protein n=1 Tax=Rubus argutus TaxID=59490 RepID=A0AAW1X756_RUBAR